MQAPRAAFEMQTRIELSGIEGAGIQAWQGKHNSLRKRKGLACHLGKVKVCSNDIGTLPAQIFLGVHWHFV